MSEQRNINIISSKDGHGTPTYKISIPNKWAKELNFDKNKKAIITLDNNKIIIEKEQ